MLDVGIENIQIQKDQMFNDELEKLVDELFTSVKHEIPDIVATNDDAVNDTAVYDMYKKQLKQSMIQNTANKLSKLIKDRIGINFIINTFSTRSLNIVSYVNMPPINYKTINMALININSLFPKRNSGDFIWNSIASDSEKRMFDTISSITDSLKSNNFRIDLKNSKIRGLENEKFVLNLDPLAALVIKLSVKEYTAVILKQIGTVFAYLEYISSTTNNTLHLMEAFNNETFNGNKSPVEVIRTVLKDSNIDVGDDSLSVMEGLDNYILKTYRIDKNTRSVNIEYDRYSDIFATRFGYGDVLSTAYVTLASKGTLRVKGETYQPDSKVRGFLNTLMMFSMAIVTFVVYSTVGLIVLLAIAGFKLLAYIMELLKRFIINVLRFLFITDVDQNTRQENIIKRLGKIKNELIKEIRSSDFSKVEKSIIIEQINTVKHSISSIEKNLTIIYNHGGNLSNMPNNDLNEYINNNISDLQNNELHFHKERLELLK